MDGSAAPSSRPSSARRPASRSPPRRSSSSTACRRRAAQEVERRRAAILEASLDAIVTIDHEGRIVELNDAAERLFGYERTELVDGPVWVEGDPVRLAQIVDNLLTNAVKFTEGPGRISIRLQREDDEAALEVRDTGKGIAPELLPHIFEPFRQGEQGIDRASGGLGLGLALVKALVEQHGGSVEAASEGEGRGTQLIVRLPLTAPQRAATGPHESAADGRRRVLVIEDDEDVARSLCDVLESAGHRTTMAAGGTLGLSLLEESEPDVVLCDLGLPGEMTGFDVARAVRGDDRFRDVLLVALTGYGRPEDKQRSERAGFDLHLTKPVDRCALERALARRPRS